MSSTMFALQFSGLGDINSVFNKNQVSKPVLSSDSHILVKIQAATINPADVSYVAGKFPVRPASFPAPSGGEGIGIVEAAGKDSGYKAGQRVQFLMGVETPNRGTWAEYTLVDTKVNFVSVVPESIDAGAATQLIGGPGAAFGMLNTLGAKSGDFLLQSAGGSAVAKSVIQLAKLRGVNTISVVRSDGLIPVLKALGADFVINSEKEDIVAKVKEIAPEGVQHVIDPVAGTVGSDMIKALARNGKYLGYGLLSGQNLSVNSVDLIMKKAIITGFAIGAYQLEEPEQARKDLQELIKLIEAKKFQVAYKGFSLSQYAEAFKHATSAGKHEKAVFLL